MSQRAAWRTGAVLVALSAAMVALCAPAEAEVVAPSTSLARTATDVAPLHAVSITPSVRAVGEVLDPAPALQTAGEIAAAKAQLAGAKAKVTLELEQQGQAETLYKRHDLPLAQLQKAEQDLANSQAVLAVDRADRAALLARTEARWGSTMAAALRTNGDPLPQLAAGQAMLVGLGLPPGTTISDPAATVRAEADGIRFELHLISRVPTMIGAYSGEGILYRADAKAGVPIGATVTASLPDGAPRTGVLVPSSAVTWRDGHSIAFRAGRNHGLKPVPVATDTPTRGGYFVRGELAPGDLVVTRGAALLLGAGSRSKADSNGD